MHRGVELAVGVIALVIAIGVFCIGIWFVFALLLDLTSSWLVALLVLLLLAAALQWS